MIIILAVIALIVLLMLLATTVGFFAKREFREIFGFYPPSSWKEYQIQHVGDVIMHLRVDSTIDKRYEKEFLRAVRVAVRCRCTLPKFD